MSATAGEINSPSVPGVARPSWLGLPVCAVLASRLIVLVAGITGTLAIPKFEGWSVLDPTRISASLGSVGNLAGAPAVRWDAVHYLTIARHGYASAANTVFFPLYPLLIRTLGWLVRSDVIAGVLISSVSFGLALFMLHRLTDQELGRPAADITVLLLAFAPTSFFFTAVYTESLFLALSVGAVLAARRGRPLIATGLGALAAVTRVTGVLVLIPLAAMHLQRVRRLDRPLAAMVAIPLALIGFLGLVAARGFGLLAPFVQQTLTEHGHRMTGPLDTVLSGLQAAAGGLVSLVSGSQPLFDVWDDGLPLSTGARSVELAAVLVIALAALWLTYRKLPTAYAGYAGAALLVSLWSPVAGQPLSSLDRYTLTIFPLWMAAGAWVAERRLARQALGLSALALAVATAQFASWAFVA